MYQLDIVFSTAHKSKGLEFETVVVANDFLLRLDPGILVYFYLFFVIMFAKLPPFLYS